MRQALLLSGFWPPHVGGIERYSYALARELAARGWEVDAVACADGTAAPAGAPGLRVLLYDGSKVGGRIPRPQVFSFNNAKLIKLIRKADYDVVIAMSHYYLWNLLILLFHRRAPSRVWVNHASGHVPVGASRALGALVHAYEHLMSRGMRHLTNLSVGVSIESSEWLRHFGVLSSGIMRNAIDPPERATLLQERVALENILFVGRLQPGKGALASVRIVEQARRVSSNELTLTVVGDGPERDQVQRLAETRSWMTVLGAVPSQRVHELMSRSDLLLYPSDYPEGLPTVILEAGAHGLPVMTFPVAGALDLAPAGEELLVVRSEAEAAQVLLELLRSPEVARRKAALLRERVLDQFTWAQTADALEGVVLHGS